MLFRKGDHIIWEDMLFRDRHAMTFSLIIICITNFFLRLEERCRTAGTPYRRAPSQKALTVLHAKLLADTDCSYSACLQIKELCIIPLVLTVFDVK